MAIGKCLLTGATGTFVKSHLTPQAFTAPTTPGGLFITAGERTRPIRTFTSWYDKKIVTRKGEDILADLDSYAVNTLRNKKLVWSGWHKEDHLDQHLHDMFSDTHGIRKITFEDANKIRLFFLSLLWRWGVSMLPAARDVKLSIDQLHQLRDMILTSNAGDPGYFPITLIQISTRGETQNMSPILTEKQIYHHQSDTEKSVPFYRFYFDGLIAHFDMPSDVSGLGDLVLGAGKNLVFPTVAYEASFQSQNLTYLKQDVEHEFPDTLRKLLKASTKT